MPDDDASLTVDATNSDTPPPKRLFVHIGAGKCGSTGIQQLLRTNLETLSGLGIVVPDRNIQRAQSPSGEQSWFFEDLRSESREQQAEIIRQRVNAMLADDPTAHSVVLSAENLSNPTGFENVFAALTDEFDVRVLMYIRRQDDYLESAWQQWFVKEGRTLLEWMLHNVGKQGNWYRSLQPWIAALGRDRISVREFDRAAFAGGSIAIDFCNWLEIDPGTLSIPSRDENPSLSSFVSIMCEGSHGLFGDHHDNDFYEMMHTYGGSRVLKSSESAPLFTAGERAAIMRAYEADNTKLANMFFPEKGGKLFSDDRPVAVSPVPYEKQREDLYNRLLLGLYREIRSLKKQGS